VSFLQTLPPKPIGPADRLQTDDVCKVFYHNWSRDGQVKEFAGAAMPDAQAAVWDGYKAFAENRHRCHLQPTPLAGGLDGDAYNLRLDILSAEEQPWNFGRLADAYDVKADAVYDDMARLLAADSSFINKMAVYGTLFPVELGRMQADLLRIGLGARRGGWDGWLEDGLRFAGSAPGSAAIGKGASGAIGWALRTPAGRASVARTRFLLDKHVLDRSGKAAGQAIDEAFSVGRATRGEMIQANAKGLSGPGPVDKRATDLVSKIKRFLFGDDKIWYQDKLVVKGAGPKKGGAKSTQYHDVEVRTHSANPKAPSGSYSSKNYTTQIEAPKRRFWSPEHQQWVNLKDLNNAEVSALHLDAGN
jgi:hypothetical protein